jgi:hypothetical protein
VAVVTYDDLELDDEDFAEIGDAFIPPGRNDVVVGDGVGRLCRQRHSSTSLSLTSAHRS